MKKVVTDFKKERVSKKLHCKDTIQKIQNNIPRKGIAGPSPYSCVCERFIYSQDRSACSAAGKYVDRFWYYTYKSLTDTWD
jgi:hypothetical protein